MKRSPTTMPIFKYFVRVRRVRRPKRVTATAEYKKYKDQALALAQRRLAEFNLFYGYQIGRVSIKNQKTRWGSCSKKGNINFNYRIATLPDKLADYLVVHELCHLGEFNHSQQFWDLVAKTIPDYRERRRELRAILFT